MILFCDFQFLVSAFEFGVSDTAEKGKVWYRLQMLQMFI